VPLQHFAIAQFCASAFQIRKTLGMQIRKTLERQLILVF
jgi:hypothetical protein